MSKKIDLTGRRFGKLKVIKMSYLKRGHTSWWECLCDCGRTTLVRSDSLRTGHTKSCGCLTSKKNIKGQRFGRLTAIKSVGRDNAGGVLWDCVCDCGKHRTAPTRLLTSKNVTSCGCALKIESDLFIKSLLCSKKRGPGFHPVSVTPGLIELKREQLIMHRQIKELKNGLT